MKQTINSAGSKTQPFLLPSETYTRKNGVVVEIYKRLEAAVTKVRLTPDTIVYHGTSREFDKFAISPRKSNTPIDEINAFFFTTDIKVAYNHASRSVKENGGKMRIIAAKLNFKKLQDVTARIKRYQREIGNFSKAKRKAYAEVDPTKYDGIEFRGDSVNTPEYVVFNPNVIEIVSHQFTDKKLEASYIKPQGKPTILKNPSGKRVLQLIKNAQYRELKGLIVGQDFYIWNNVEEWHHGQQAIKLKMVKSKDNPYNLLKDFDDIRLTLMYEHDNDDKERLLLVNASHNYDKIVEVPALRKLIKEIDLYLDGNSLSKNFNFVRGIDYMKERNLTANLKAFGNNESAWIKADGELLPVKFTHPTTLIQYIKQNPELKQIVANKRINLVNEYEVYEFGFFRLNWCRIFTQGDNLYINFGVNSITRPVIDCISQILKDNPYENIFVDVQDVVPGSEKTMSFEGTTSIRHITEFMRRYLKRERVEAMDPQYGYWFTHEGSVVPVKDYSHDLEAAKIISRDYSKQFEIFKNAGTGRETYKDAAFKHFGWIRTVNESYGIGIEACPGNVAPKAFTAFRDYLKDQTFQALMLGWCVSKNPGSIEENDGRSVKVLRMLYKNRAIDGTELNASDPYGYWITDKGEIEEVPFEGHYDYVKKLPEIKDAGYNPTLAYKTAFRKGWVRIVNEGGEIGINFMVSNLTRETYKSLTRLLSKELVATRAYYADLERQDGASLPKGIERWTYFKPEETNKLLHFIGKHVKRESVTAADAYGYWITADGKMLEVEYQSHNSTAEKYIVKNLYNEYFNFVMKYDNNDFVAFCLSQGWIRLVTMTRQLDVQIMNKNVSSAAVRQLMRYMDGEIFEKVTVDINALIGNDYKHFKYESFDLESNAQQRLFSIFMRSHVGNVLEARSDDIYGYWITEEGELLKVEDADVGHVGAFLAYIKPAGKKKLYSKAEVADMKELNYWAVLSRGWIRIVFEGFGQMNVEIAKNSVSRKAYTRFTSLLRTIDASGMFLDVNIDKSLSNMQSEGFAKKHDLARVLEQNVNRVKIEASTSEPYFTMQALRDVNDEADNRLSRVTLIMMKPSDFLKMAEPAFSKEKYEKAKQLNRDRIQYNSVPFLIFENNGDGTATVIGHEGRHRSMVLKELGDKPMPVAFKSSGGKGGSIRWGSQKGYDKIETWPEVLIGEGSNKSNRIPFPQSEYYPHTLEALDESEDTFECWITDKEIVPSPQTHIRTLKSIIFKKGNEEYLKELDRTTGGFFRSNDDAYRYGTRQLGFIRVVGSPTRPSIMISKDCVHPNAFKQLVKYFKDRVEPTTLIFVDVLKYYDETNYTAITDFHEIRKQRDLITLIRKNIAGKNIVAIDGDNNIQWTGSEVVVETWQTGKGYERFDLVQQNTDYIVRQFNAEGALVEEMPYRFQETARDYLRERVDQMQSENVFYTRLSDLRQLEAADDEKVFERWESPDGRYATVFGEQENRFIIKDYMKNALTQVFHVVSALTLARRSKNEAQAEFTKHLRDLGGNFKKVDATKSFVTPKETKKLDTAQVRVRGNSAAKITDGFKLFSKQPNIKGLQVVIKKISSYTYAKVLHEASGLAVVNLTSHPIGFSPTELVERINNSDLGQYNWSLPKEELFNRYGDKTLLRAAQDFYTSLSAQKQDATDKALDQGLKGWVRDYLIARFLKQVTNAKAIKRNIDKEIKEKGLDETKVYYYYGNPDDPSRRGRDTVLKNIGMVRTIKGYEVIKRETAKPVEQPAIKPTRDDLVNAKIAKQRESRHIAQRETIDVPLKSGTAKDSMIGQYVIGFSGKTEYRGIVLKQVYNKRTGRSSGEVVVLNHEGDMKSAVIQNLTDLKRTLKKPPQSLISAFNIISARNRIEAAITNEAKAKLKSMNKAPGRQKNIRYSLRLKPGQYVTGQFIGFRGMPTKVKGILIVESYTKNNNIASGGVLIMKRGGNFEVRDTTHLERLYLKPPVELQKQFDKLKKEGRIPALRDFE